MKWVARNPVLCLAAIALVIRYGMPLLLDGFSEGVAGAVWTGAALFLAPFSRIATGIDPWLQPLPEWVDVAVTLALGLLPYLVLDFAYRGYRRRGRRTSDDRGLDLHRDSA
jgi:hypothetical protein